MSARRLLGNKQQNFDNWAKKVGLLAGRRELDDVRYQHTPEVRTLRALLSDSKTAPGWLNNPESPEYKHYKSRRYGPVVSQIPRTISSGFNLSDNNPTLNEDIGQCLQPLLSICLSAYRFEAESTKPDKSCYLNALLETHWSVQSPNMFQGHRRPLRLPEPLSTAAVIPDSSVFFTVGSEQYTGLGQRVIEGCTALHGNQLNAARNVLHWVTEYKRYSGPEEARRQVYEGLATALHQRRALGFTDHFVFGTCHFNQTQLEIVAASWVSPDDEDNKADSARIPKKVCPLRNEENQLNYKVQADNALPYMAIRQSPYKRMDVNNAPDLLQSEETHNRGKQKDNNVGLVRDLEQRNKIAVYHLNTYCMRDIDSITSFYLLMRRTRDLAMEYREAITTTSAARMEVINEVNPKLFDWYKYNPLAETGS